MQNKAEARRKHMKSETQMTSIGSVEATSAETSKHRRLLVPIDFSKASVNALRYARHVASDKDAELTLLHVIEEPLSFRTLDFVGQQRARRRATLAQLDGLAQQEIEPGTPVKTMVCEGSPAEQIRRVASNHGSDVIIVGRQEAGGLAHWFGRDTSSSLANQAPCQVLVLTI